MPEFTMGSCRACWGKGLERDIPTVHRNPGGGTVERRKLCADCGGSGQERIMTKASTKPREESK
jgi:hypothetical protein